MTLVAVDAVVDVARHMVVLEVVRIVSAVAARALEDGIVIGVRVARGANVVGVAMARWELCVLPVVERRACPGCRVVAILACLREELRLRFVTWIRRVVVIRCVASIAIRWQRRVVVVNVAIHAMPRRRQVGTGQGEGRVVVVERRVCPVNGVMA